MNENENISFDCNRGVKLMRDMYDELNCTYQVGCCKLKDYDWLSSMKQSGCDDIFEIRFKNTRKAFYKNATGLSLQVGDIVVVEATSGYDVGIITLSGATVARQKKCKCHSSNEDYKKIYRKAKAYDIEKWQDSISREHSVMIQSRKIAAELGLEMKIGDVEFQGDGTKAIFYYIADTRVDFRQLIKLFAEAFRIRIEMKQIGARQEAGLIGGIGVCGRELCCSNHISSFKSITTSAARCQDLSLNPQKLAGQCGKLKCCLNYEVASYLDAQSRIPRINEPLELEDGQAFLMKTDILRGILYFSYEKTSLAKLYPLTISEVKDIMRYNKSGRKACSLKNENENKETEFVTAVGDDSITRFDKNKKTKRRNRVNNPNKNTRQFKSKEDA